MGLDVPMDSLIPFDEIFVGFLTSRFKSLSFNVICIFINVIVDYDTTRHIA